MTEACVEPRGLELETIQTPSEIGVTVLGRAGDAEQAKTLPPVLGKLLEQAHGSQRTVKLHFEGAQHLNSAALRHVMAFLVRAEGVGVRVVVTYDGDLAWQRLSFRAIQRMGLRADRVEVHGL